MDKKQRQMMMQINEFNKRMAQEKQQKMEDDIRREMQRDIETQERIKNEKKDFFKYAEKCINNWESQGKNVMPMLLEMKKYKDFMIQEEERKC